MMKFLQVFVASFVCFVLPVCSQTIQPFVLPAQSPDRIFSFTNKQSAFFCGIADGENNSGFHGITQEKEKLFEQYWIRLGEKTLPRKTAEVIVTPWNLTRKYFSDATTEEVVFCDSLNLLFIRITSNHRGEMQFIPALSQYWEQAAVELRNTGDAMQIIFRAEKRSCIITAYQQTGIWTDGKQELLRALKNPAPIEIKKIFLAKQCSGDAMFTIEFLPSASPIPTRSVDDLLRMNREKHLRIETRCARAAIKTNNASMNLWQPWIRASLDALVMNQSGIGIYAGLPWFDDYWGRDTFISLPGAFLVTGEFERARDVLRTFAQFQNRSRQVSDYGRIPNRVTPTETIYNTADGTPWFVRQAHEYVSYSGDTAFIREILPTLEIAIEGAKKFWLDGFGFLTHKDSESWMDAVGENGAWSPRGTRAVEIQSLWIDQLETSAQLAKYIGETEKNLEWSAMAQKARENFRKKFFDEKENMLVDRLHFDNTRDAQIRPNALIALSAPVRNIVPEDVALSTMQKIFRTSVYRYGVASLSQSDPAFHPYHQHAGYYPKDAAYHNGVVWTWLSGPAVSLLCRYGMQDTAFHLTEALNSVAASQGQIGSLPELLDAVARKGDAIPKWSGTFSQAWSLAEYERNIFQDYLGIKPDALSNTLRLSPRLPRSMSSAETDTRIRDSWLHVQYDFTNSELMRCSVTRTSGNDPMNIELSILHRQRLHTITVPIGNEESHRVEFTFHTADTSFTILENGVKTISRAEATATLPSAAITFTTPFISPDLASIRRPGHAMLEPQVACSKNPLAPTLLSKDDPAGDDVGPTRSYSYPANKNFQRGIFDLRNLTVQTDNEMVYFTVKLSNLTQPGWHPEYGFQLTMLALAIDQDGLPRKGNRYIRHNAGVVLPDDLWYERLILVGGGVQVFDKNGAILCEFIPSDERYLLGDVEAKTISFAIPVQYLGKPNKDWDYYLVAGGQDDHGGAGIGEFRTVLPQQSEWNGGGNASKSANIYDVLKTR